MPTNSISEVLKGLNTLKYFMNFHFFPRTQHYISSLGLIGGQFYISTTINYPIKKKEKTVGKYIFFI